MSRKLDTTTLDNYGRQFAVWWIQGHQSGFPERDRAWLKQEFYNFTFKDEFDHLAEAVTKHLVGDDLAAFQEMIADLRAKSPRSDEMFASELADRLAIDPDGNHIPGKIGTVQVGQRIVGRYVTAEGHVRNAKWPIYAGEDEEREAGSDVPDALPDPAVMHTELVPNGS